MEYNRVKHRPNPRLEAGFFNRLFFCWLIPIFLQGKDHDLETKDIYEVLPENRSGALTDKLEKFWNIERLDASKQKRKPSLVKAIQNTFKWPCLQYGIHYFFSHLICKPILPLMIGLLISQFDEKVEFNTKEAYLYTTGFILITVVDQMLFNHSCYGLRNVGIKAKTACASLVYRKIMKLPHSVKQGTSGKIMTLLSNDVVKLELSFLFIHAVWVLPLQTLLIMYLIGRNVGALASIVGVLSLFLQTIPVQAFCARYFAKFRRKIAAKTDERLLLTGEIIHGIRVIKMYTWEKAFEKLVFFARSQEINRITKASYLKNILWAIQAFAQRTPLFLTIMIYVLQGNQITAYTMFTLVQYFNIIHVMMSSYCMRAVNIISEAIASVKRIQEFLLLQEQVPQVKHAPPENEDTIISIKGVTVSFREKIEINILNQIDFCVKRNMLYAVVGPVGAGKSLLLKLILDELKPSDGQVTVHGDISYSSQEPWIFKGTIKNNILFGEPYKEKRYDQVVKACALLKDFEQLPNGDKTVVGESGATLSGGQCARINLARAVYRNADVYLLDNPLSAVDSRVGKRLFEECINGLLKDKTRILVTHQLQYLKEADEIILLDKGRIQYQGDFENLDKTDELFQHLHSNDIKESEYIEDKLSIKDSNLSLHSSRHSKIITDEDNKLEPEETEKLLEIKENAEKTKEEKKFKVITKVNDEKESLYWKYFSAGGSSILPILTLVFFMGDQFLASSCDYFVAYWTKKQVTHLNYTNSTTFENLKITEQLDSETAIYIFGALMVGITITSVTKMILFTIICRNSNQRIHNTMAASVIKAPVRFFDNNDSGQILNRFSKDLGLVDERLQAMMIEALIFAFIIVGVVSQIVIINSWSIIVIIFIAFLFYKGRAIVIKTTRDIMRIEGEAKSPVFTHVNVSFAGIVTIRSCKAQSMVCKQFDYHQDNYIAANSITQYALIAYSFWLDAIVLVFTALLCYSFLIFRTDHIAGADVGLAITQLLILCGVLARGIKLTSDVETQMISVERLFEYTRLEREDEMDKGTEQKRPSDWPKQGKIKFDNVSLSYISDTPVLKELNFTIRAGAKIGIVGRTGAGKSSLITALFRLAKIDGSIFIDDVDTKKISLKHLRNKISILPQEPILFSVPLRKNLDPLEEFDDATLWTALQDVELNKAFNSLDIILDQNNLSVGQRQLLCLARAILKKNKILILDEATANVDVNTDALIQKTIRAQFKDCTVLIIAHRLNTVMDCDKILVMNEGRVVEYDRPQVLLKQKDGYFSRMLTQNIVDGSDSLTNVSEISS